MCFDICHLERNTCRYKLMLTCKLSKGERTVFIGLQMLFLILLLPPTCISQVMKKNPQGYINDDQTQKISS